MLRVKELLRLAHELGYSKRQVTQSIRMPKTTAGDYLAQADAAGLCYADVAGMSEEAVEALLFQRAEPPEQRPRDCREFRAWRGGFTIRRLSPLQTGRRR